MAIYVPGQRDRKNRRAKPTKRNVVAVLSLTAMVDMFTVLAVFLLQNYNVTGQVIELDQNVELPNASSVKELKPSNVVTISDKEVSLNNDKIVDFRRIRTQEDWMVVPLKDRIERLIQRGVAEERSIGNQIRSAVQSRNKRNAQDPSENPTEEVPEYRKLTIQADKGIDFLSIKKVMYTATEAGIYEINFAVLKKEEEKEQTAAMDQDEDSQVF